MAFKVQSNFLKKVYKYNRGQLIAKSFFKEFIIFADMRPFENNTKYQIRNANQTNL